MVKGLQKMKSVINEEIEKNQSLIEKLSIEGDELGLIKTAREYIKYHEEVLSVIDKIEKGER